ncbi:MAG: hypothetical protein FP824_07800, partial [Euryarchaeota archaeon]|nr:hypothetical protein [Euryarchaeota archaeon]
MKAKLTVKEVGGLRGEHVYELESGKTWLLKSSNSGGKTSLLRALSAVLSVPQDGDFGKYPREEAIKLGIQTEDVSPKEGFVNVHSKQAEVTLEIGDVTSKYIVTRDGNYISLPHNGDPRFLLAGVISNNSKILRQLRNVDGRDQPDDFEWAVRELSKAARYEDILNLLKNKRDEYSNQVITVNRKVKDRERLEKEETNLIQEKTKLDKKLDDTKFEDTNIEELIKKREKLIEKIDNKRTAISDEETKIKETKGKLNEIKKSIKIIQKENKEYEAELKKFDLEK